MADSTDGTDQRHSVVKAILLSALQREGEARERFLEQACEGDRELQAEVEELLAEEEGESESGDGFLAVPAVLALSSSADALSLAASAPTPLPDQIGPFRLLEKLGQGGMGTVYRADQIEPVRRQVALKVISTSFASRQRRLRFAAECQALARLSHPNIASMYEAGTTSTAQPFIAIELVEGTPIHHYVDEHKMEIPQRLELFLKVCAGVQHAHQKGILHRDLKPTNILVTEIDGEPVPKVIDFGIAKAIDQPLVADTIMTAGQVIGSPAYMSPEAATLHDERDLDTRADVYALGVMLLEILVGVRRFEGQESAIGPLLRRVAEEEPTKLSSRWQALDEQERRRLAALRGLDEAAMGRRLRGDLDAIVLKAMALDRERRYASVADLAADIRRHLALEPILARPPSWTYLWSRFLRRHAAATTLAGLFLLVVILALGLLTRETRRALRAEEQSRQALAEAQQVSTFLVNLFEGSDPETAPGEGTTLREILDRGASRLETELVDQPLVRARLLQTIGDVYLSLGLLEEARQRVEEALALRRAELPAGHPEITLSLNQLGIIERRAGHYDKAEPILREVVALRQAAAEPDLDALALAHSNLGNVLWNEGRYPEAEASYQQALQIQRQLYGEDHRQVAATLLNLGTVYWSQKRFDEAQPLFERSAKILDETLGPLNPRSTAAWNNLGILLSDRGDLEAAKEIHEQVLAKREKIYGPDHYEVAASLNNLGIIAGRQKRYDEAEALHTRALEIRTKDLGPDHPLVFQSLNNLASVKYRRGQRDEAEALYWKVLAGREASLGPEHPDIASTLSRLGEILSETGRSAEAEPLLRRSLAIRRETYGTKSESVESCQILLAEVLIDLGQRQEAATLLRELLPISEALHGGQSDQADRVRNALAEVTDPQRP